MRDLLGWDCEEGCDCVEKGHVHISNVGAKV